MSCVCDMCGEVTDCDDIHEESYDLMGIFVCVDCVDDMDEAMASGAGCDD